MENATSRGRLDLAARCQLDESGRSDRLFSHLELLGFQLGARCCCVDFGVVALHALSGIFAVLFKHGFQFASNGVLDAAVIPRFNHKAEYPISRFWTDARVMRIYGGTSEIMKEIVARGLLKP